MWKLATYLVEAERTIAKREMSEKENEINNVRNERDSYLSERDKVIDANQRMVEKIKRTRVMWLFIGLVVGFIIKMLMAI